MIGRTSVQMITEFVQQFSMNEINTGLLLDRVKSSYGNVSEQDKRIIAYYYIEWFVPRVAMNEINTGILIKACKALFGNLSAEEKKIIGGYYIKWFVDPARNIAMNEINTGILINACNTMFGDVRGLGEIIGSHYIKWFVNRVAMNEENTKILVKACKSLFGTLLSEHRDEVELHYVKWFRNTYEMNQTNCNILAYSCDVFFEKNNTIAAASSSTAGIIKSTEKASRKKETAFKSVGIAAGDVSGVAAGDENIAGCGGGKSYMDIVRGELPYECKIEKTDSITCQAAKSQLNAAYTAANDDSEYSGAAAAIDLFGMAANMGIASRNVQTYCRKESSEFRTDVRVDHDRFLFGSDRATTEKYGSSGTRSKESYQKDRVRAEKSHCDRSRFSFG